MYEAGGKSIPSVFSNVLIVTKSPNFQSCAEGSRRASPHYWLVCPSVFLQIPCLCLSQLPQHLSPCTASGSLHPTAKGPWNCTTREQLKPWPPSAPAAVSCLCQQAPLAHLCTSGCFYSLEQGGRNHKRGNWRTQSIQPEDAQFPGPCRGTAHAVQPWASYLPSLFLSSLKCRRIIGLTLGKAVQINWLKI